MFFTSEDFLAGCYMISRAKILFKSSITSKMSKDNKMQRIEMLINIHIHRKKINRIQLQQF